MAHVQEDGKLTVSLKIRSRGNTPHSALHSAHHSPQNISRHLFAQVIPSHV